MTSAQTHYLPAEEVVDIASAKVRAVQPCVEHPVDIISLRCGTCLVETSMGHLDKVGMERGTRLYMVRSR